MEIFGVVAWAVAAAATFALGITTPGVLSVTRSAAVLLGAWLGGEWCIRREGHGRTT